MPRHPSTRPASGAGRARAWLAGASLLAAVLALGACSQPEGGGGGVASLGGENPTETTVVAASKDFNEARLEWAECMRENGVDVPDPGSEGGLRIDRRAGDAEDFEKAQEACQDLLQGVEPPGGAQPEQMQERILALTECMREKGFDMPDPQFSTEGGRALVRREAPEGVDVESKEFQDAARDCQKAAGLEGAGPRTGNGPAGPPPSP